MVKKHIIESLTPSTLEALMDMVINLWPDLDLATEKNYYQNLISDEDKACFLLRINEAYAGFIHLELRTDYVEGATSSPIAYIEGIYMRPAYRKKGWGHILVNHGEEWARANNCTQYASDTDLNNINSHLFHLNVGFTEASRAIHYIKDINVDR